jgi:hypothetical protein
MAFDKNKTGYTLLFSTVMVVVVAVLMVVVAMVIMKVMGAGCW